ncbi:uroporphyrinogen-III synthase [Comamonas sp. BIGb0124]|uniref:uroporphyrinogen-III synthase n=1 Tax=Comamonas sp. BIGb0124 TaxID=2485130 RepID=UPI0013153D25|nr:uroporphyrinogen-III synthase [Comamonas sp. BIGb0124]
MPVTAPASAAGMSLQVIVTRPAEDAGPWAARLQAAAAWSPDWQLRLWPLIGIRAVADPEVPRAAVHEWRSAARAGDAMMFVSANAVRGWAALQATADAMAPRQAWAVGPSTVEALRQAGWPSGSIVAPRADQNDNFDSEALWRQVEAGILSGACRRVLIVRGSEEGSGGQPVGRDWLTRQLLAHGVAVRQIATYERARPVWDDARRQAARLALTDGSIWLMSSAMAVAQLGVLLGETDNGRAQAIATHDRIAQTLRAAGWGRVQLSHPDPQAVAASIKSLAYARST